MLWFMVWETGREYAVILPPFDNVASGSYIDRCVPLASKRLKTS
jgi:hypothetical protein